jgi:ribose/xylose/arabinose/galactoside ABC-type transport system permease subunit
MMPRANEHADDRRTSFLTRKPRPTCNDTSFIAIMAVGMSIVIIAGAADCRWAAIYALASVIGLFCGITAWALWLRRLAPAGNWSHAMAALGNGHALRSRQRRLIVAPASFQYHARTMAIIRGAAVATTGQSIGGFPPARGLIRYMSNSLSIVPPAVMLLDCRRQRLPETPVSGRHIYAIGGNEVPPVQRHSGGAAVLVVRLYAGVAALLSLGLGPHSGDGQDTNSTLSPPQWSEAPA